MQSLGRSLVNILFSLSKPFTLLALIGSASLQAQQLDRLDQDVVADHNSAYAGVVLEMMGLYCTYKNNVQPFLESARGGFKVFIRARTINDGRKVISYELESETKYLSFKKEYDSDLTTSVSNPPVCMVKTKGQDIPRDPTNRR